MKLATYRDGSRDGQLVVVSRDLSSAHYAHGIASRLQQVLDDWNFLSPQLQDLATTLNHGKARHAFPFEPAQCMAPLPRAYQWVQGGASPKLSELLARAAVLEGGEPNALASFTAPELPAGVPVQQQCPSDDFWGPHDEQPLAEPEAGLDFGPGLAAFTGDVAQGAAPAQALEGVRLLGLVNSWRFLRGPGERLLPASWAPVAITPDELGEAWRGGRAHLTLQTRLNGRKLGQIEAGPAQGFHFGQLMAQIAKTRRLRAGSLVGTGTLSAADAAQGAACLAELRAREQLEKGKLRTQTLQYGDKLRIEMLGADGLSVFGAIETSFVEPE